MDSTTMELVSLYLSVTTVMSVKCCTLQWWLLNFSECQEDLKLPARVMIELRPRYNEAWSRVQAVSHNPRIRTLLPLQRRLSSLLVYLNSRWRPSHMKHVSLRLTFGMQHMFCSCCSGFFLVTGCFQKPVCSELNSTLKASV